MRSKQGYLLLQKGLEARPRICEVVWTPTSVTEKISRKCNPTGCTCCLVKNVTPSQKLMSRRFHVIFGHRWICCIHADHIVLPSPQLVLYVLETCQRWRSSLMRAHCVFVGLELCTPATEKALQAWLMAGTPGTFGGGKTPSAAMMATPHMQGLLQRLRISTPALGPQVALLVPLLSTSKEDHYD